MGYYERRKIKALPKALLYEMDIDGLIFSISFLNAFSTSFYRRNLFWSFEKAVKFQYLDFKARFLMEYKMTKL